MPLNPIASLPPARTPARPDARPAEVLADVEGEAFK
jgi:hypothetical protein